MDGLPELVQLAGQRTWDKELVLWVGTEAQLSPAFAGLHVEKLDLLDLFDRPPAQIDDDDVRQLLSRSLRNRIQSLPRPHGKRRILIVRSAALLARYRVGVREFYEWFCDDFSMVVLVVEGLCDAADWPDEVECDSKRMLAYFTDEGMVKRHFSM